MLKKNLKKYIIFQIWGSDPLFLIGLIENIKLAPSIYPGWKIRIYFNNVPDQWLELIKTFPVELIKEKFNDKLRFQIWRILPLFDKKIDIFICRDTDSRINFREKVAVEEWINLEKPIHIMRDHPTGHKTIILAGMCGFNNIIIKKTLKLKNNELIHQLNLEDYDSDQEFLRKIIFPFFANNHLAHDKYRHFNFGCEKDFPPIDPSKKMICNFVGEVHDYYNNPINWSAKKIFKELNYDNISYSIIYGLKIPSEIECLKINKNIPNTYNPFELHYCNLIEKQNNLNYNKVNFDIQENQTKFIEYQDKINNLFENNTKNINLLSKKIDNLNIEKNNLDNKLENKIKKIDKDNNTFKLDIDDKVSSINTKISALNNEIKIYQSNFNNKIGGLENNYKLSTNKSSQNTTKLDNDLEEFKKCITEKIDNLNIIFEKNKNNINRILDNDNTYNNNEIEKRFELLEKNSSSVNKYIIFYGWVFGMISFIYSLYVINYN